MGLMEDNHEHVRAHFQRADNAKLVITLNDAFRVDEVHTSAYPGAAMI